ncbi:hypothetical protein LJK88_29185 [Paenibacillus sp. P26]|nr:hypothetical protein LJK88_29185 [Paenibacillus sp. P26]
MPELPEMENYRILLSGRMAGKTITETEIEREKSINVEPEHFRRALVGQAVQRIERRAKHLLFHLSSSDVLVLHLMLGGMMYYGRLEDKPERSVQVRLGMGGDHLFLSVCGSATCICIRRRKSLRLWPSSARTLLLPN